MERPINKSYYPRGAVRCLTDVNKIIDKEPNIPKLVEEYKKLFCWKCPICKKTFSTKQLVSTHINNIHINKTQNGELISFLNCCARQHLKNLKNTSKMKKETLDLYYYEKDTNRKREIEKEFKLCLLYYNLYNLYYYEKIRKKK